MSLRLTNTLTGRIENFTPLSPNEVTIYCCGVTVYDLCHLGHARSYISWDVLHRYLIWQGNKVTFIQNFTDIDDKILNRAYKENCAMSEVSERNIAEFHSDMNALGILPPTRMPRATKCLHEIVSMISELEKKGAAYSIEGDVYFSVMKHRNYGKLSGRKLSEQQHNVEGRVTKKEEARKQNPFDFALWKGAKDGEPSFNSPWGHGRPGWHIECSAMVLKELGETIDIHLGGSDLIFPHHENEIAQSEVATGKKLAQFWLHNGMVNVEGQKMSKSLGNFTTIRALLEKGVSAMALRLFVLQAHYRKPLDFTEESLGAASSGWKRLNTALNLGFVYSKTLDWPNLNSSTQNVLNQKESTTGDSFSEIRQRFIDVLNDDLNTSAALAILFEIARPLKSLTNKLEQGEFKPIQGIENTNMHKRWETLVELASVLGLKAEKDAKELIRSTNDIDQTLISEAIEKRRQAKMTKDFTKADQIRQELKKQGIELIDKPGGVTDWIKS